MLKNITSYLNPIAHLGEKKYSIVFPLITTLIFYILSEIFAFFILRHPLYMGNANIILTFLLVIYFAFRSGIKGGMTTVIMSTIFFTYYIFIRRAAVPEKIFASETVAALTVVNTLIAFILGGLRQTVDTVIDREKQARLHAEETEEKFKTLANNIPNLAWMTKPDGYIFWYNSRWYEYTGTTPKQMMGWGWKSVHDPKVLPQVLKKLKASIKTVKPFEMVFPLKGADGNFRDFLTRTVPVCNQEGKVCYWFGTNTDITEQKQIEQKKDDFIGMIAHELRTPITSTKIYVQSALKACGDNPRAVLVITKMNEQIDKLSALINTMLDTTRLEQGKTLTHEEPFILKEVALPTISSLQDISGHKMVVDWQTGEYLYGNKEKIAQVFTNLITNAMKFSPKESEIIIKSQRKNGYIVVSVQDFGVGLSKEEQKHIFDRFYQSREHKTYPGLGLGLYISTEIVKQHGGKMWVESEKGKGTTFYFSLPVYKTPRT